MRRPEAQRILGQDELWQLSLRQRHLREHEEFR